MTTNYINKGHKIYRYRPNLDQFENIELEVVMDGIIRDMRSNALHEVAAAAATPPRRVNRDDPITYFGFPSGVVKLFSPFYIHLFVEGRCLEPGA